MSTVGRPLCRALLRAAALILPLYAIRGEHPSSVASATASWTGEVTAPHASPARRWDRSIRHQRQASLS